MLFQSFIQSCLNAVFSHRNANDVPRPKPRRGGAKKLKNGISSGGRSRSRFIRSGTAWELTLGASKGSPATILIAR